MRQPLPLVLQNLADIANDAMGDVHDMDTTIRDFARAAAEEIWANLAEVMEDECKRIAAIIGGRARLSLSLATDRASINGRVGITVYPTGTFTGETFFAPSFTEALKAAEGYATTYANDHRVMTAADLGIIDPACPKCAASKFACDDHFVSEAA